MGLGVPTAVLLALEASAEAATITHGAKLGGCVASAAPRAVAVDAVVGLGGRGWRCDLDDRHDSGRYLGWLGLGLTLTHGGGSVNRSDLGFLLADRLCVGTLDRGVLAVLGVLWAVVRPWLVSLVGSVKVRRGSAQGV